MISDDEIEQRYAALEARAARPDFRVRRDDVIELGQLLLLEVEKVLDRSAAGGIDVSKARQRALEIQQTIDAHIAAAKEKSSR